MLFDIGLFVDNIYNIVFWIWVFLVSIVVIIKIVLWGISIIFCILGHIFLNNSINKKNIKIMYKKILNIRKIKNICYKLENQKKIIVRNFILMSLFVVLCPIYKYYTQKDKYNFVPNSLETESDISILFTSNEKKNSMKDWLQNIHYNAVNSCTTISPEMISGYTLLLQPYYGYGTWPTHYKTRNEEEESKVLKLQSELKDFDGKTSDDFVLESKNWNELYSLTMDPACLYQYGRSMQDAVWTMTEFDTTYVEYCSEAIQSQEEFLMYIDREINYGGKSIVITIEDIAFSNAKVYYALALTMEEQNLNEYVPNLWALAYSCMLIADKRVNSNGYLYAIIQYYLGNLENHMLDYIIDTNYKKEIIQSSITHYSKAKQAIVNGGIYKVEDNMQENIEKGLKTMKNLAESAPPV